MREKRSKTSALRVPMTQPASCLPQPGSRNRSANLHIVWFGGPKAWHREANFNCWSGLETKHQKQPERLENRGGMQGRRACRGPARGEAASGSVGIKDTSEEHARQVGRAVDRISDQPRNSVFDFGSLDRHTAMMREVGRERKSAT